MATAGDYHPRLVDGLIDELLRELPALLIVGARATGKTTTAARHSATVLRLDRPADASALRADPDAVLRGLAEPVLLDEWQVVPEVLGAVKRAVDTHPHPGRFLVTGSVRADLEDPTWPGTGRLIRLPMTGLTVRELLGRLDARPFLDRLAADGSGALPSPSGAPDLRDYIELALRSGFPAAALYLSPAARQRWIGSYIDQLLTRDVEQLGGPRDPARLRRYFEAFALNSAGAVDDKTLTEAAGINYKTADAYEHLLRNLLVVDSLPAWTSNRLKRLVRGPKRYLVDPALLAGGLRMDANSVLTDGNILGRVLDTFVLAQLRAEIPICSSQPRLYHLRQEQGRREIDIVVELAGQRVVGIEIKADSAPRTDAARHLAWLRDELGESFVAGVVLHTGPRTYELADRILAAPICTLWA